LYNNPEFRQTLATAGLEKAGKQFNLDQQYQKFLAAIKG